MSNNIRKFIVQAEFEYEAELFEGDPKEPWAFADIQQNEIRAELQNVPGVLRDYPIKVSVFPDRDNG